MCTHGHQEYGDPELMARLSSVVGTLRVDDPSSDACDEAEVVGRAALNDGNPWARSLARGVLTVVALRRAGRIAEARELVDSELMRALPA